MVSELRQQFISLAHTPLLKIDAQLMTSSELKDNTLSIKTESKTLINTRNSQITKWIIWKDVGLSLRLKGQNPGRLLPLKYSHFTLSILQLQILVILPLYQHYACIHWKHRKGKLKVKSNYISGHPPPLSFLSVSISLSPFSFYLTYISGIQLRQA